MAALPTDFSVTSARGNPTPSPEWPIDTPVINNPVTSPLYDEASIINSVAVPDGVVATQFTPEDISTIDTATPVTPQPDTVIDAPISATSQSEPTIDSPSLFTASTGTATTPPFPLNHARIQWNNLLFNYLSVAVSTGSNGSDSIIPNTFEKWDFTASSNENIIITLPANVDIDTVCICAHNLDDAGVDDVEVYYDVDATTGGLIQFGSTHTITNNNAIMFHISSSVSVRRIRIDINGGTGEAFVGYISAGVALQMQRPFFGGYTPVCENLQYEYFDAWTESGQLVGRSERSVMVEGGYSWQNIDDTWYRSYFEPFKRSGHRLPFVVAWNLDEYPNDVEMVLANSIKAATYTGTRKLRSIDISVRGPD